MKKSVLLKKLSLISVLVLSTSIILTTSGCANRATKAPQTITLWHYYNANIKTQFDDLTEIFNETVGKEKGIIIDSYSLGGVNELSDAVYSAANKEIGAKAMPNIFSAYSDSALRIDNLGAVASLDSYFTEEELALYRPEFIEDGRFDKDNSLKIVPIAKSTELSFLNLTEFEKFAAKTGAKIENLSTWEDIVDTAENYYEWSGGKAFFGIDSMANFIIIGTKQLGQDIFITIDGKTTFNLSKENAKKFWNNFYVPYVNGYFSAVGRFRSDDMKSGNIIMFIGSSSSASFFPKTIETGKDTTYDIKPQVMPYPTFAGGDKYCVAQGAGMVVAKSDSKTEKACVEFLKWLTQPEQNAKFAVTTSYIPVQNKALSYDEAVKILNITDEKDILLQSSKSVYRMLNEYKLYAAKPFSESFTARGILDTSLKTYAQGDLEKINDDILSGKKREEVLPLYVNDQNFEKWYKNLINEMGALL